MLCFFCVALHSESQNEWDEEKNLHYTNSLALNVHISYLRKALRDDTSVQIESLMKKGYVLKTF